MPRACGLRLAFACMDRNRSAPVRVRDGGALLEGDEDVGGAGEQHLGTQLLADEALEAERDVEHEVLLLQTAAADGAGVVAAVAGVDDDAARPEAQLPGEAVDAGPVGLGRLGGGEGSGGALVVAAVAVATGRWSTPAIASGAGAPRSPGSVGTMPFTRRVGRGGGGAGPSPPGGRGPDRRRPARPKRRGPAPPAGLGRVRPRTSITSRGGFVEVEELVLPDAP